MGASLAQKAPFSLPYWHKNVRYPQYWKLKNKPYPVYLINDLSANSLWIYQQGIKQGMKLDACAIAEHVAVPTMLYGGGRDQFIPRSYVDELAKHIRGVQYHVIPEGDHVVMIRHNERMAPQMLAFIEETNL
jgi:pimeloyl-ACP methyl ester carboxylesterase